MTLFNSIKMFLHAWVSGACVDGIACYSCAVTFSAPCLRCRDRMSEVKKTTKKYGSRSFTTVVVDGSSSQFLVVEIICGEPKRNLDISDSVMQL